MLGDDVLAQWRVEDHDARDDAAPGRPRERRRRAGLARPGVGGRGPADHDRLRRTALLRRVQRRARRWSRPGLAGLETTLELHNARADRRPAGHLGRDRGQSRPRRGPRDRGGDRGSTSPSTSCSMTSSGSPARSAARSWPCTPPPARRRAREAMQPVDRALRHRRDDEQRLSARPEPLPGGQGHVGRRRGRPAGRHDHLRRGVPRRPPRPRLVRRAPRTAATRRATSWPPSRASPSHVPDQWQVQIQARVQTKARVLLRTDGLADEEVRAAHLEPDRRHRRGRRSPARGRTRRPHLRPAAGAADDRVSRLT